MDLKNRNLAYDLSLFEETPKKRNIVKLPQKSKKRKAKLNLAHAAAVGITCALSVTAVATFVYGQVQLNELTAQINVQQKALNESQSVYTQLQVKSESQMSLSKIENYAVNELGMIKLEPSQIEHVKLPPQGKLCKKQSHKFWNFLGL